MIMFSYILFFLCSPLAETKSPGIYFMAFQQEELEDQLKDLDSLMRKKDNLPEVLERLSRLRVESLVLVNRYDAATKGLAEKAENSRELKKDLKDVTRNIAKVADALMSVILHPSRKRINTENMKIWTVAVESLGQLRDSGGHNLWQIFSKNKKFREQPEFLRNVLVQIGVTQKYDLAVELINILDHSEFQYIAGAAEALAQFDTAPGKVRRQAVESLSKYLAQYYEDIQSGPSDEEANKKYRIVAPSMTRALKSLTGEKISHPLEWTTWWNKNKSNTKIWKSEK